MSPEVAIVFGTALRLLDVLVLAWIGSSLRRRA